MSTMTNEELTTAIRELMDESTSQKQTIQQLLVELHEEREERQKRDAEAAPVGTIASFGGNISAPSAPPDGWLVCDGRSVSKSDFPLLFAAIGNAWGGADETTFRLPNLNGHFLRGADPNRAVGSLQGDATRMPNNAFGTTTNGGHTHSYVHHSGIVPIYNGVHLNHAGSHHNIAQNAFAGDTTSGGGDHSHGITGGDSETRPINAAVNWIIKADPK